VACVTVAWLVTEGAVHDTAGYGLLGLMTLRILWGFAGPDFARFAQFVKGPAAVWRYTIDVWAGREKHYLGHNPLGGWMIVALLTTGIATSLSGWLYTTDAFWGVTWVERLHAALAYLMLALAALHVAGVVFTSLRQRENLLGAMVHGRKNSKEKHTTTVT
jgi:cytochrome b